MNKLYNAKSGVVVWGAVAVTVAVAALFMASLFGPSRPPTIAKVVLAAAVATSVIWVLEVFRGQKSKR